MKLLSIAPVVAAVLSTADAALPPVSVKGNAFFTGDKRFYVRGVAYQPGGASDAADPLLDIPSLKRDIERFKELGINTIRIYTIDNSQNHDEGMKMLDDAGIYLALDVNTPKYSLNRENPELLHMSYNDVYLQSVFATVDAFAKYSNLLVFFSANEVINARNNTNTAPYIKAVTRDLKQYISNRHSRVIPVGYSAADVAENIRQQALYFNCGTDDERSDFFAFNDYSWCDPSDFIKSGWNKKVEEYSTYSIPLFLSEFGCITNRRDWNEIGSLYHSNMTSVYSGGLAYEYTTEPNGFGLVEVGQNGQIQPNADFQRLAASYKKTPVPTGDGGFKTTNPPSKCPPADIEWEVSSTLLPAIPEPAKKFMTSGAGAGPGLKGEGSQWHGTPSKTDAKPGSGKPSTTPAGNNNNNNNNNNGGNGPNAAASLDIGMAWKGSLIMLISMAVGAGLIL